TGAAGADGRAQGGIAAADDQHVVALPDGLGHLVRGLPDDFPVLQGLTPPSPIAAFADMEWVVLFRLDRRLFPCKAKIQKMVQIAAKAAATPL
ncbi:MAG: hypothetical protein J0H75_10220, partial [Rhizobiales bacterium]|nr:hypothetical protein [Hyphomicrobiales bacterium]